MTGLYSLLSTRPDTWTPYSDAFAIDRAGADALVARYQDMWDSGDSFLAEGMDAFTFPKRESDSDAELNACLVDLARALKWFAAKSYIKSLSAADIDCLYRSLSALPYARLNFCGCDLSAEDVKSIFNS